MKKIVYIAHPISGNYLTNMDNIMDIYTEIVRTHSDVIPFVPYFITVQALNDLDPKDREIGFEHNKEFFQRKMIDELWFYGLSKGVETEIAWANEFGIKVVDKQ